jgi:hypothetical protein
MNSNNQNSYMSIYNISINDCSATGTGGAIKLETANFNFLIQDSFINNCSSTSDGGGIYILNNNNDMKVINTEFNFNRGIQGGAIASINSNSQTIIGICLSI